MDAHIEFTAEGIVAPDDGGRSREVGAVVEFWGVVREMEKGRAIAGLNYEAYEPMARRELEKILGRLNESWNCEAVWFVHRLGWVPVGEASLYVRVQASHREAAFRLCMELIDWLKQDVPIWKVGAV